MNKRGKYNLSYRDLKSQLYYNQFSGIWRWRKKKGKHQRWDIAGSYHKHSGYHTIRVNNYLYKAHILAFLYIKGYLPENQIDHINRIRDDNRWCNLREVSQQCNVRNSAISSINTSGVKGVSWGKEKNSWESYITINKKRINLGRYKDFNKAVKARWDAEVKYNWPNCNSSSSAYLYLKERGLIDGL